MPCGVPRGTTMQSPAVIGACSASPRRYAPLPCSTTIAWAFLVWTWTVFSWPGARFQTTTLWSWSPYTGTTIASWGENRQKSRGCSTPLPSVAALSFFESSRAIALSWWSGCRAARRRRPRATARPAVPRPRRRILAPGRQPAQAPAARRCPRDAVRWAHRKQAHRSPAKSTEEKDRAMEYDLLVRGGLVLDGSGQPAYRADVGVRDGSIVALGALGGSAARTIDATGLAVAPGFIDHHTHLDAQMLWDPYGTCEPQHGVTSVVMGNCGLTLAPVEPGGEDALVQSFVRVEAMPRPALEQGVPWGWRSFGEYLDRLEGRVGI